MNFLLSHLKIALLLFSLEFQFSSAFTSTLPSKGSSIKNTAQVHLSASKNESEETDKADPSFSELGIHPSILNTIWSRSDWEHPTPVQQLAIPRLLDQGTTNAFWCEAPTGSGKTAAFLIPLLQSILINKNKKQKGERVTALVLCPTRELCVQIGDVLDGMVKDIVSMDKRSNYELSTMVLHGGVPLEPQISRLADCVRYHTTIDILVATPGRLIDVLTSYDSSGRNANAMDAAMERKLLGAIDSSDGDELSLDDLQALGLDKFSEDDNSSDGRSQLASMLHGLRFLVLDESDRLLGKGFKGEMDSVVDLLASPPATWLFSATFPKSIEPRLDNILTSIGSTNSPVRLVCANSDRISSEDVPVSSSLKKKLDHSNTVTSASKYQQIGPASTIKLRNIRMEKTARTQALRKLLEKDYRDEWDRVLVFVSTRYASEHVSKKLRRYGIKSSELHGKLDQNARLRRLNDLKTGKIRVLLCTDVASRGIDISGLPAVINYDLPRSTSDFVHRIGRTGRAGQEGTAVSFVTPSVQAHMDLIEKRHLETPPEREVLKGFEPNEERWAIEVAGSKMSTPGTKHSSKGLVHDKMFGGIKGHRKSKKDKLREAAARAAAAAAKNSQ
eukprot:CAMPEP_0116125938 /NCGR_PEP_ID=MMETSP0329-20121206/6071_1 /TAXON_ID=697910 /ORGANISM="Pseudo-nitzschia arenysensis, Strain B593" /LENGTH=615 /DNA_ID=CAMNT_0003619999 /DNA_START=86 /DNA_END=1933 /DNA_ORIENTATION=+